MADQTSVPPGRDENPTVRPKRIGITAVASVGLPVAGYLTLYQLDVFSGAWDPFFLGVLAYGTEIGLSFIGRRDKWRTAPWTVLAFGGVISSGAVASVFLTIVQPTVANTWCTLCLTSAFISLAIFGWGADEPLAALQHLKRVRASGDSVWRAFWGLEDQGHVGAPR